MSQENVETVRRLFEAVASRDSETVLSLYHPEVEWDGSRSRWAEVLPGDGRYTGHEGIRRFSRQYFEIWESFQDTAEELIDAGDHAVVSVVTSRGLGRSSGVEVEFPGNAGVWTVVDGKIVRVVWFPSREEALEAVGLRE
jgi:ketosteroid isomerase-like protein